MKKKKFISRNTKHLFSHFSIFFLFFHTSDVQNIIAPVNRTNSSLSYKHYHFPHIKHALNIFLLESSLATAKFYRTKCCS